MPFGNRQQHILEDVFSSVLSQFKKYHPPENQKFNYLGFSKSLKLRILMGVTLPLSLKLNFTPNNLGCYGLIEAQGTQPRNFAWFDSRILNLSKWSTLYSISPRHLFLNQMFSSFRCKMKHKR